MLAYRQLYNIKYINQFIAYIDLNYDDGVELLKAVEIWLTSQL